ncbi:hypothetical protein ACOSP7_003939 [Xanthoceras sorbifolium]
MGHLMRECPENVHNVVDESQLYFDAWMRAGSVGYSTNRVERSGQNRDSSPSHTEDKEILLKNMPTGVETHNADIFCVEGTGLSQGDIVQGSRGLVKEVHEAYQSSDDIPYMFKEPENVAGE